MRGPMIFPLRMALRSPTSMKSLEPTSRTVVKPASSVRLAYTLASSARSAIGFLRASRVSRFQSPLASPERCVWASMRPGNSVASPRSITSAPAGSAAPGPMAVIFSPATTTKPGETARSLRPSNIRAALITMAFAGVVSGERGEDSVVCAWVSVKQASAARIAEITVRNAFSPFRCWRVALAPHLELVRCPNTAPSSRPQRARDDNPLPAA